MEPTEVDVNSLTYYNPDGTVQSGSGTKDGSGTGWLAGVLGALPGVLSALFPSGVGGNNSNNYPTITTNPAGTTTIGYQSSNNMLIYILLAIIIGFLFFQPGIKPKKSK